MRRAIAGTRILCIEQNAAPSHHRRVLRVFTTSAPRDRSNETAAGCPAAAAARSGESPEFDVPLMSERLPSGAWETKGREQKQHLCAFLLMKHSIIPSDTATRAEAKLGERKARALTPRRASITAMCPPVAYITRSIQIGWNGTCRHMLALHGLGRKQISALTAIESAEVPPGARWKTMTRFPPIMSTLPPDR